MKKFLALLFVCAGLTAMAAPHVNKADLSTANKGQMVMKANTLSNQLTASVSKSFMEGAKKDIQRHNLVNTRAQQPTSDEELTSINHICFLYAYDIMGDEPVPADPFYAGSGAYWYPDLSEGLYFAGFYWDAEGSTYYLPLDVNYTTGEVALPWGLLLKDDTTSNNPGGRNRTDTIKYELLVSQDYWENQNQTDCMGTLYADGSIIFDDNYVYYTLLELKKYQNNNLVSDDATETATMYVGTEILAPNGNLTYNNEKDGSADSSPVYIYQSNDTVFVGNMWNYGMPNSYRILSANGTFEYPCAYEEDGTTYLYNPIWDVNDTWISGGLGEFYPVGAYTLDDEGYIDDITWGFTGDVTPTQMTWAYTMPANGYHFLYGYENNVLRYTNGNQFVIPSDALRGDVDNDGEVAIADVTALVDALLTGNLDDSDNFNSTAADVDGDGEIAIADVTALIDYLLTGVWND